MCVCVCVCVCQSQLYNIQFRQEIEIFYKLMKRFKDQTDRL